MKSFPSVHLLHCLAVYGKTGNIKGTAGHLNTTEATVSRQLKKVEEYFQFDIFETIGRNKRLTKMGGIVASKLCMRLNGLEDIVNELSADLDQAENAEIRIGAREEILALCANRIKTQCRLKLMLLDGAATADLIRRQALEIGITASECESYNYTRKCLFVDDLRLVIPRKWINSAKCAEDWAKTCDTYPYAQYSADLPYFDHFRSMYGLSNMCRCTYSCENWNLIRGRVEKQLNWSLIPSIFLAATVKHKHRDIVIYRLKRPLAPRKFYVYFKRSLMAKKWFRDISSQINKSIPTGLNDNCFF